MKIRYGRKAFLSSLVLVIACLLSYGGYLVYKSFQPGTLVVCGFQPNQQIRVVSPQYFKSYSNEISSNANQEGVVRFTNLGQGSWYVLDHNGENGWYESKYLWNISFYVAGLEELQYYCLPKWKYNSSPR